MTHLFHCETVQQFRIMAHLEAEGITPEDIQRVELVDEARVRITNPAGQWMELYEEAGKVRIDRTEERRKGGVRQ